MMVWSVVVAVLDAAVVSSCRSSSSLPSSLDQILIAGTGFDTGALDSKHMDGHGRPVPHQQ